MHRFPLHRLALSVAGALLATGGAFEVSAGTVLPGNGTVVGPGTPAEQWTVQDNATLTLQPGAEANAIQVLQGGRLITDGATVSDASTAVSVSSATATLSRTVVTSTGGTALSVGYTTGSNLASVVQVDASTLRGAVNAITQASRGELNLSGTTAIGGTNGLQSFGGNVSLAGGSHLEGGTRGIWLRLGGAEMVQPSQILVDASTVKATSGAAIEVMGERPGGSSVEARIAVRNGSQLVGGNGTLLQVWQGLAGFTVPTVHLDVQSSALNGNIVVADDGSQAHVTLSNGGSITGTFTNVTSATLGAGGRWQLTGNSDVGTLALNDGGVLALGDGSTFNTLSVDSFAGTGGTVIFNTVLGDDGASTDRLHVRGDTSGSAHVAVNNVGGAGAQTVNGIELIQVDGASNGQFDLAGRAVGGQYEYFLHKGGVAGGEGNWYLRSQLPTAPDPCDVDPTLPHCGGGTVDPPVDPAPVLRPEGGAYLANLIAARGMFRLGYHDRQAGQNSGRGWARVDGARTGFDAVSRQLDVHGSSQALTVGADLLQGSSGSALGVMLASGNASSTSRNPLTGYYARGKAKGEALGVYATWRAPHQDPYAGFYVDGSLQRAQFRNRVEGVALAPERYDSNGWQGAVEAGYALRLGGAANGGLFLEPQLQVGYSRWDDLRHTESNGTVVTAQHADGAFGRAGVRLSGVTRWEGGGAQVQPYIAAHWLHQRAQPAVLMDDAQVDARIPRSRGEFSAGASLAFANGFGAWAGLALQRASGYHQTSAQLGLSYRW